jgi:hypothetical protein
MGEGKETGAGKVIKKSHSHSSYNTNVSAMISNKMHESQFPGKDG